MSRWFTFARIGYAMQSNAFLYALSRLPALGALLPRNVFRYQLPKALAGVLGAAAALTRRILPKNLIAVLLMYYAPQFALRLLGRPDMAGPGTYAFCFLTVGSLLAAVRGSDLIKPGRGDVLFLNHFMLDPQQWYRHKAVRVLLLRAACALPALVYVFGDWRLALCLAALHLLVMTAGDAAYLRLFDRHARIPGTMARTMAAAGMALVLYALCALVPPLTRFGPAWLAAAVLAALLTALLFGGLLRHPRYKAVAVEYASANKAVLSVHMIRHGEMNNYYLNETAPDTCRAQFERHRSLGAWQYFDRVFRLRFARAARSHRRQSAVFMAALAVGGGLLFRNGAFGLRAADILQYSSVAVTTVLGMAWAGTFLELCYLNMDAPLLYHRFYDAATIRASVTARFGCLMRGAGLMFCLATAGFAALLAIAGAQVPFSRLWPIFAVFALLLYAFETLHLAAYYLLQPYTRDCTVKSPLYTLLNAAQGLLTYGILLVRGDMGALLLPLAALSLAATLCLAAAVRLAPRTFVLR